MNNLKQAWKNYNISANILKKELGRTSNLVGEYAEYIICEYLSGELLTASHQSADIETKDGLFYQVKARKTTKSATTQLGIIRSWNFDFLAVVLFTQDGEIIKALLTPKDVAKEYAKKKGYENGFVISTTKKFLEDQRNIDITNKIK